MAAVGMGNVQDVHTSEHGPQECVRQTNIILECACLLLPSLLTVTALAADQADLDVVYRIKSEAFDHSKVMENLEYLSDVYGPRLTASPEFNEAADWAVQRCATTASRTFTQRSGGRLAAVGRSRNFPWRCSGRATRCWPRGPWRGPGPPTDPCGANRSWRPLPPTIARSRTRIWTAISRSTRASCGQNCADLRASPQHRALGIGAGLSPLHRCRTARYRVSAPEPVEKMVDRPARIW